MHRILLALLPLALIITACGEEAAISTLNPNRPNEVPTSYLITQAERSLVDLVLGEGFTGIGTYPLHYIQQLSQTKNTELTRYHDAESSFYPIYTGGLKDLQAVIELNSDPETSLRASIYGDNGNQRALAMILQSWAFLSMTDFWGDLPYSGALQGVGNPYPVYDRQEEIYRGAVNTLLEAGDLFGPGSVEGDIIYYGDMESWRRFANSLVLRAGIRVADVAPELGKEWVKTALQRGVFQSNFHTAQLIYSYNGEYANNTFYTHAFTHTDYAISEPMVEFLKERNDLRLAVYAQPTEQSLYDGEPDFEGMPYGMPAGQAGDVPLSNISFPGLDFIGFDAPATLMTYSEVLFNQAEAAARGWTGGDAARLYGDAVRASFNQHGIYSESLIRNYLEQRSVAFDAADFRKSIGEQKWIALYFQGLEAWSEWRRLGYPQLEPAPQGILIQTIPTRRAYPPEERKMNGTHYLEALQRQFGGDTDPLDGRVWWDVE